MTRAQFDIGDGPLKYQITLKTDLQAAAAALLHLKLQDDVRRYILTFYVKPR